MKFVDVNLDMQSWKYEENRKGVTERKQEHSRGTASIETPIAFSYRFGFQKSKRQIKPNHLSLPI